MQASQGCLFILLDSEKDIICIKPINLPFNFSILSTSLCPNNFKICILNII